MDFQVHILKETYLGNLKMITGEMKPVNNSDWIVKPSNFNLEHIVYFTLESIGGGTMEFNNKTKVSRSDGNIGWLYFLYHPESGQIGAVDGDGDHISLDLSNNGAVSSDNNDFILHFMALGY